MVRIRSVIIIIGGRIIEQNYSLFVKTVLIRNMIAPVVMLISARLKAGQ